MENWDQYEVWQFNGEQWEFVAGFRDLELANAIARNRRTRMRLIHATYIDGKLEAQEIVIDLGNTRDVA